MKNSRLFFWNKQVTILPFIMLTFYKATIAQTWLPFTATVYDSTATSGYYFIAPKLKSQPVTGNKDANMILDKFGEVIYYRSFPAGVRATDFKLQANGLMTYSDIKQFYIMDSTFTVIDSVRPKNDLKFDGHEFQLLPNGHCMFIANEKITMDLSPYKFFNHHTLWGNDTATVKCGVIQELDANKNVTFEWHTSSYFKFDESDEDYMFNPGNVDWTHCNALELDYDGNILLSSRDFNEITKINKNDSAILWRWGGKKNQFAFINDPVPFRTQHDCRRIANGHLTIWDNGFGGPFQPATAREYVMDETNLTATPVWSYIRDSAHYSDSRGNFQRLGNGNSIVSYGFFVGPNIVFTSIDPAGNPILEVSFIDSCVSYRAFNYPLLPWNLNRPVISCELTNGHVYLSVDSGLSSYKWNTGDTTYKTEVTGPGTYSVFIPRGNGGFIRSEKYTVSNLANPFYNCPVPAQPGLISGSNSPCFGSAQTYSVSPVPNATSYTWSFPNGWTGSSASNSITVHPGTWGGMISVVANNACGSSTVRTRSVQVTLFPSKPGFIKGPATICPNTSCIYSVSAQPGVTGYTWSLPAGWSGSSTGNSIAVLTGSLGGTISVFATNGCSSGLIQTKIISMDSIPAKPSLISGSQYGVCNKQNISYTVNGVKDLSYNWSFNTNNASISSGQGNDSIRANFSPAYSSGTLSVTAVSTCYSSPFRSVAINSVPKAPVSISGPSTVCQNQQGVAYSIPALYGATSYTWTGPAGSRFSDGINTSVTATFITTSPLVTVNFKTTAGQIKVKGNNSCGSGGNQSLPVVFNCRRDRWAEPGKLLLAASPNPSREQFTLSFLLNREEPYALQMTDLTGRILKLMRGTGHSGLNEMLLDAGILCKGIYLLRLQTASGNEVIRLVVD